jgi:hypothetical protein
MSPTDAGKRVSALYNIYRAIGKQGGGVQGSQR